MLPALACRALGQAFARRHGVGLVGAAVVLVVAAGAWPLVRAYPLPGLGGLGVLIALVAAVCQRRGPPHGAAVLALLLSGAGFVLLLYWFFNRVFYNLATLENLTAAEDLGLRLQLIQQLVTLVFSLGFTLLFMSTPGVALSALYQGDAAAPLLLAPRSALGIFGARFAVAAVRVSAMALGVLVPCLVALGRALGAGPGYYVVALLALVLLLLPPVVAGCGVTALLVRAFPVARLQQVLTVLTVLILAAVVILVRASQPERLLAGAPPQDLQSLRNLLDMGGLGRLPGGWAAAALVGTTGAPGAPAAAVASALGRLALLAAGAVGVLVALGLTYARTWARAHERTTRRRRRAGRWPRRPLALLWRKDIRLFARDAKEWSQLLMLVALVVLYLYNISRMPQDMMAFRSAVAFINLGVLGFMLAALHLRFTFSAMALEGPGLWSLLKAPLPRARILWEKVLFTGVPLGVFALVLTALAGRMLRLPGPVLWLNLGVALLLAVVLHPLALAFGLRQYRPPEDDPVRMALSPAGLLYMVASFGYVLAGLLLAAPAMVALLGGRHFTRALGVAGLVALVAVSTAVAGFALRYARRRLERLEC
jgi:ABC-2 type transport system permease protein